MVLMCNSCSILDKKEQARAPPYLTFFIHEDILFVPKPMTLT